jgi:hypothetical protein
MVWVSVKVGSERILVLLCRQDDHGDNFLVTRPSAGIHGQPLCRP